MSESLAYDLPSELCAQLLRRLSCWELVSASRACALWRATARAESLWRRAAEHRWPLRFRHELLVLSDFDAGGAPPLVMPAWARRGDEGQLEMRGREYIEPPHHPRLLPPPDADASEAEWRAYYLQHDLYEAMNVAPVLLPAEEVHELHARIGKALRWCSPVVSAVAVELPRGRGLVSYCDHLKDLVIEAQLQLPSAEPVTRVRQRSNALRHWIGAEAPLMQLRSLWMLNTVLTYPRGVDVLSDFLTQWGSPMQELALCGTRLGPASVSSLCNAMCEASPLHRLQRLSLASCRLGDGGVRRLCDQLRHCALLSALDLSHNAIGPLGTAHVAKLLVLEPAAANGADGGDRGGDGSVGEGDDDGDSVEAMDVEQPLLAMEVESTGVMNEMEPRLTGEEANSRSSCSDCGGVGMSVDVPSRPADTQAPIRLVYLDLSCNPLGAGGVECISLALQTNSCLRHLAMRYVNANPPEGDARLEPAPMLPLLRSSSLSTLELSNNFLAASAPDVDHIRDALAASRSLKTIRLDRCCIGGWRRARAIARGLLLNCSITELQLGYNGIGAASGLAASRLTGATAPNVGMDVCGADPLKSGSGVVPVNANDPPVSLAVDAMCQALRANPRLRIVGLAHNCLGDAGATSITLAALDSTSLTSLDLRANGISLTRLAALRATIEARGGLALPELPPTRHGDPSRRLSVAAARSSFGSAISNRSSMGDASPPRASPGAPPAPAAVSARLSGATSTGTSMGGGVSAVPMEETQLCVDLRANATLDAIVAQSEGLHNYDVAPPLLLDPRLVRAAAAAAPAGMDGDASAATSTGVVPASDMPGALVALPAAPRPAAGVCAPMGLAAAAPPPLLPTPCSSNSSSAGLSVGLSHSTGATLQSASADGGGAVPSLAPPQHAVQPAPFGTTPLGSRAAAAPETNGAAFTATDGDDPQGSTSPSSPLQAAANATAEDPSKEAERAAVASAARWAWQLRVRRTTVSPYYMSRQPEVDASMRRILIEWLIELYDELRLSAEVLLTAVHHVDRFLSAEVVPKESLQLVGAVALMVAYNSFCKLPKQDGEPPLDERGLTTAEDVVYWTDSTYGVAEVLDLESRMVLGMELSSNAQPVRAPPLHRSRKVMVTQCRSTNSGTSSAEGAASLPETGCIGRLQAARGMGIGPLVASPRMLAPSSALEHLRAFALTGVQWGDEALSLALEILIVCAREYSSLRLPPKLLAACCLFLAVRNAPLSSNAWESPAVAATGVTAAAAGAAIEARLGFLHGKVVEARSLSSTNRERTLSATLHVLS